MKSPIRILSTDFDGTLHTEGLLPPVPMELQHLIADLQERGMIWVVNTGRDLLSLTEGLENAHLSIAPDFVVTVEREIHERAEAQFVPWNDWNQACSEAHRQLFARVQPDLPRLARWIHGHFKATVYEDPFSPLCLIAANLADAEAIHEYLDGYCLEVPDLTVVRNDIYARFSHTAYNKGSALGEIARRLGVAPDHIAAAGDHLNDLPMLSRRYARWLVAPGNSVPAVQDAVRAQGGFVSRQNYGSGVAEGLRMVLRGEDFLLNRSKNTASFD